MKLHPAIIIPTYNHKAALTLTLATALKLNLPTIVVDDGSKDGTAQFLESLKLVHSNLIVLIRTQNGGKGEAIKEGVKLAKQHNFTHLIQIDADGQHNFDDIPKLLEQAEVDPMALVCAVPQFGKDAPWERRIFRELTNLLVWLETGSFKVRDALCGFRIYPIHWCAPFITAHTLGSRMEFDVEVIVKLLWAGAPVRSVTTKVTYPLDGISHFRLIKDNLSMILLHFRLFPGVVIRAIRGIFVPKGDSKS